MKLSENSIVSKSERHEQRMPPSQDAGLSESPALESDVMSAADTVQRIRKRDSPITPEGVLQLQSTVGNRAVGHLIGSSRTTNPTGMPDALKSGLESLAGLSMDHVRVRYNSPEPATVNARAFTRGGDIHVAPGQEKYLPHEGWHAVQQSQGRVRPTIQAKGVRINNDDRLEREADLMGAKALSRGKAADSVPATMDRGAPSRDVYQRVPASPVMQLVYIWDRTNPNEAAPQWSEDDPPRTYLPSGKYDDGVHGEDDVYARMSFRDLFYSIAYGKRRKEAYKQFMKDLEEIATGNDLNLNTSEGLDHTLSLYEQRDQIPMLEVEMYKGLFGGSSGWDMYSKFLEGGQFYNWGEIAKNRNPGFDWTDDVTGVACQKAMVFAIANSGSVRFSLDGMAHVRGILEGTKYLTSVTSFELRFAADLVGKTLQLPGNNSVQVRDGVNVFFYLNRQLVPIEFIKLIDNDTVHTLARKLAEKIGEEEEWNEFDDEVQDDLRELQRLLSNIMTIPQLLECLSLP